MAFCTVYCPSCHNMLKANEDRDEHLATHHVESGNCWVVGCDDPRLPPGLLHAHIQHFHEVHPFEHVLQSTQPKKEYQCGVCSQAFSARQTVTYCHANKHTGETPYSCKWSCGLQFGNHNNKRHHETNQCTFRPQSVDEKYDSDDSDLLLAPSIAYSSSSSGSSATPVLSTGIAQYAIIYRLVHFIQLTQALTNLTDLTDPQGQIHTFLMEELLRRRENTYQHSGCFPDRYSCDSSFILQKYQPEYQPFVLYTYNDESTKGLFYTLDIPNDWCPAPDARYVSTFSPKTRVLKKRLKIDGLESSQHSDTRHEMLLTNITFDELTVEYFNRRSLEEAHPDYAIRRGILIFVSQDNNYRYMNFFVDTFKDCHHLYLIDTKNKQLYLHATAKNLQQFSDHTHQACSTHHIANGFSIDSIDNLRCQVREDQIGLLSTVSPVECAASEDTMMTAEILRHMSQNVRSHIAARKLNNLKQHY